MGTSMLIAAIVLSVLVGVVLGMLGGGGSILTVPILLYVLAMPAKQAIATSLFVVAVTSAAALLPYARRGLVAWRTGLAFGFGGMLGAYAGGRLSVFIPGPVLLIAFALMMAATAFAMLRRRDAGPLLGSMPPPESPRGTLGKVMLRGLAVGTVTGVIGAGGGFLIVPALVLFGSMSMRRAVATSLFVISVQSLAGLAGHLRHVAIDYRIALLVAAAAVLGAVAGGYLARGVPARTLRVSFGWLMAVMSVLVIVRELPGMLP